MEVSDKSSQVKAPVRYGLALVLPLQGTSSRARSNLEVTSSSSSRASTTLATRPPLTTGRPFTLLPLPLPSSSQILPYVLWKLPVSVSSPSQPSLVASWVALGRSWRMRVWVPSTPVSAPFCSSSKSRIRDRVHALATNLFTEFHTPWPSSSFSKRSLNSSTRLSTRTLSLPACKLPSILVPALLPASLLPWFLSPQIPCLAKSIRQRVFPVRGQLAAWSRLPRNSGYAAVMPASAHVSLWWGLWPLVNLLFTVILRRYVFGFSPILQNIIMVDHNRLLVPPEV